MFILYWNSYICVKKKAFQDFRKHLNLFVSYFHVHFLCVKKKIYSLKETKVVVVSLLYTEIHSFSQWNKKNRKYGFKTTKLIAICLFYTKIHAFVCIKHKNVVFRKEASLLFVCFTLKFTFFLYIKKNIASSKQTSLYFICFSLKFTFIVWVE